MRIRKTYKKAIVPGKILNSKSNSQEDTYSCAAIIDIIYPIGSIYMSTNSIEPSVLFGGTWEALGGRFLVGADSGIPLGSTGGDWTHYHGLGSGYACVGMQANGNSTVCHVRTSTKFLGNSYTNGGADGGGGFDVPMNAYADALGGTTEAQSNTPPYLAVNMWKRIS